MKIGNTGPLDVGLSELIKEGKHVSSAKGKGQKAIEQSGEATKVNISSEARQLQKIAALAQSGDELRAEKVSRLKEQILRGEYNVEATDVARGIVRSEIARLLGESE